MDQSDSTNVPGLDADHMDAWRGFLEAHRRLIDILEFELRRDQHLSLAAYDVLVQLSEAADRSLRMQELADAVLLSKSGLSRLIDRMAEDGLVAREMCQDDARGVLAVLTDAGMRRIVDAAPTHIRGVREHFVGVLKPGDAAALAEVFDRMVRAARPA